MSTLLPLDDNGHPINILGVRARGTQTVAVGASSTRTAQAFPVEVEIVSLVATGPCRFEVGGPEVTADPATSAFLYPGVYIDLPLGKAARYVAFVAEGAEPCTAYVIARI